MFANQDEHAIPDEVNHHSDHLKSFKIIELLIYKMEQPTTPVATNPLGRPLTIVFALPGKTFTNNFPIPIVKNFPIKGQIPR